MEIQEVQEIVEDIRRDLASVKWTDTTPTTSKIFDGVTAKTFSGTGDRWTHNFIVFEDKGKPGCEGSAIMLTKPLIVRYTPEIGQAVLKLLQDGGFCG